MDLPKFFSIKDTQNNQNKNNHLWDSMGVSLTVSVALKFTTKLNSSENEFNLMGNFISRETVGDGSRLVYEGKREKFFPFPPTQGQIFQAATFWYQ